MLEYTSLVLLTICSNYIATEYTIYSDGWVPVTQDQVYNQIRRQWVRNIIYSTMKPDIKENNLSNLQPNTETTTTIVGNSDALYNSNQDIVAQVEPTDKPRKDDKNTTHILELTRIGKKMIYAPLKDELAIDDTIIRKNDQDLEVETNDEMANIVDKTYTYEVTEDTYNLEDDEQNNKETVKGYIYTKPISEKLNFSSTLSKILSKYNIKSDDNLKNYDLSRQVKTQNPIPYMLRPYRYNNLNHLPVDPLLAVFLSNYGFYLPSLYGIKSNYNNLYGYLASNNIHNNRPFGLYKVFSDTDSWN